MRIGQLAEHAGVNAKTIRYYESIGLLAEPERTAGGYRTYEADDADRLVFIRSAQRLGLSLDGIREVLALRDQGHRPCGYVLNVVARHLDELDRRITEMIALRNELRERLDQPADENSDGGFCGLIERHIPTR